MVEKKSQKNDQKKGIKHKTASDKVRAIVREFWHDNAKDLAESANECYCNTPVREFREAYFRAFGTTKVLDVLGEEQCEEILESFARTAKWEKNAWDATAEFLEKIGVE